MKSIIMNIFLVMILLQIFPVKAESINSTEATNTPCSKNISLNISSPDNKTLIWFIISSKFVALCLGLFADIIKHRPNTRIAHNLSHFGRLMIPLTDQRKIAG